MSFTGVIQDTYSEISLLRKQFALVTVKIICRVC